MILCLIAAYNRTDSASILMYYVDVNTFLFICENHVKNHCLYMRIAERKSCFKMVAIPAVQLLTKHGLNPLLLRSKVCSLLAIK